jgi:hypothetical protein
VDSYSERSQLELQARRYLIPYLDLGMDVHAMPDGTFTVSGQVILSMPDQPCLRCMGFLRDALIAEEAQRYGDAGPRPQVVWSNGTLASLAVGLLVQLVLPWTGQLPRASYLELNGDASTVKVSERLRYVPTSCNHFHGVKHCGDPWFGRRNMNP